MKKNSKEDGMKAPPSPHGCEKNHTMAGRDMVIYAQATQGISSLNSKKKMGSIINTPLAINLKLIKRNLC